MKRATTTAASPSAALRGATPPPEPCGAFLLEPCPSSLPRDTAVRSVIPRGVPGNHRHSHLIRYPRRGSEDTGCPPVPETGLAIAGLILLVAPLAPPHHPSGRGDREDQRDRDHQPHPPAAQDRPRPERSDERAVHSPHHRSDAREHRVPGEGEA